MFCTMYIIEYTNARKLEFLSLEYLYTISNSFTCPYITNWNAVINIENANKFEVWCKRDIVAHGYVVPFHYIDKTLWFTKECIVLRDLFNNIVVLVRWNLIEIAQSLASEIR